MSPLRAQMMVIIPSSVVGTMDSGGGIALASLAGARPGEPTGRTPVAPVPGSVPK